MCTLVYIALTALPHAQLEWLTRDDKPVGKREKPLQITFIWIGIT